MIHGTSLPFPRTSTSVLYAPAIDYAANGFPVSKKFREYIDEYERDTLSQYETIAKVYGPGGADPRGDVIVLAW